MQNVETRAKDDESEDWTDYEDHVAAKNEFKKINEKLIMGDSQVFVSRGSFLVVFDLTANDLVFKTHIQGVFNDPDKILNFNQDQNLLILHEGARSELQVLDLNRGEVAEKWDVQIDMNDYFSNQKGEIQGSLIGLSDYSIFIIDPRLKEKVVQKNDIKPRTNFLLVFLLLKATLPLLLRLEICTCTINRQKS